MSSSCPPAAVHIEHQLSSAECQGHSMPASICQVVGKNLCVVLLFCHPVLQPDFTALPVALQLQIPACWIHFNLVQGKRNISFLRKRSMALLMISQNVSISQRSHIFI